MTAEATEQQKWTDSNPYSERAFLEVADSLLAKTNAERPFSVRRGEIVSNQDPNKDSNKFFPSTYHLRICDFSTKS